MPSKSTAAKFKQLTRIFCHFPLDRLLHKRKPNQVRVIRDFMDYLRHCDLSGFTMSTLMDAVCKGFWRTTASGPFEEENVVIFMIDHPLHRDDPVLEKFVVEMKAEIQRLYQRYAGEKEQEVWIVVQAVERVA